MTKISRYKNGELIGSRSYTTEQVFGWIKTALDLGTEFESGDKCIIGILNTSTDTFRYIIEASA